MEWEEVKKCTEDPAISDYADWCYEKNFGVKNFGLHPKYLPLSKIRCEVLSQTICAIVRKVILVLRQYVDRCSDNNFEFDFFIVFGETHATEKNCYV